MTLLTDQLPLISSAPDGITKLRELILELAVRGKLVSQDARDEPASEVLNRIALRTAPASGAGMKNKKKESDEIAEAEKRFELPLGWVWIRFGQVAQHNSGKTLDNGRNSGELRDYITTSNLYWGRFKLDSIRQMLIREDELERCTARKGDLLICEGGEAGRAAVWALDSEVCFQNHIHRARLQDDLVPHFFYRLFERLNATGEIEQYRKGVGISNMSGKSLASIVFPLPPIAEQHRIVAKVDELMALCDTLEAQQANAESAHAQLVQALLDSLTQASDANDFAASWQRLSEHFDTLFTTEASIDGLKQTVLQLAVMGKLVPQDPSDEPASELLRKITLEKQHLVDMRKLRATLVSQRTEDAFDIPVNWMPADLCDLVALVTDGDHQPPPTVPTGVPFLVIGNVNKGRVTFDGCRMVSRAYFDALDWTRKPTSGDLLYTVTGSFGITVPVDTDEEFCVQRHVAILKAVPSTPGPYLRIVLKSAFAKEYASSIATGIAQKTVPLTGLRKLFVPLPPADEQRRIVAKVDQLMALCDQLNDRIRNSRDLNQQLASTLVERAVA